LLAASDLVVLPSLREGLSIALLEAMAAGKPIIATSIGSQREVASHADMARLVRPADAGALRDAIVKLAGDEAQMARLGKTARSVYQSRYTENRMLHSYRQLYFDLLAAKCPVESSRPVQIHNWRLAEPEQEVSESYSELVRTPGGPKGGAV
jgi:glycosyltransferase involved in cell wall biosynthesis